MKQSLYIYTRKDTIENKKTQNSKNIQQINLIYDLINYLGFTTKGHEGHEEVAQW